MKLKYKGSVGRISINRVCDGGQEERERHRSGVERGHVVRKLSVILTGNDPVDRSHKFHPR